MAKDVAVALGLKLHNKLGIT
ncbi:hypothetical protein [Halomonas sp.]